ncbi:hypothetical protein [Planomicrobium okeanokoites]|uniref:Uncharacterized protein n=1 Tax=Planomicrobium okeanokoites TaxID=244 RepID=A0ABV7KLC7_PLAOK|nr:hypothetical protein [Planomicrobium okeanokoites]TAA69333.1 hypothetical protein D2910_08320 [Planomicrobium okeanokoites]
MKVGTLLYMVLVMILLSVFFFGIEPRLGENRWAAYAVYMALFFGLLVVSQKLEEHFEFLRRKMDGKLGVLIIFGLLAAPFFLSMVM